MARLAEMSTEHAPHCHKNLRKVIYVVAAPRTPSTKQGRLVFHTQHIGNLSNLACRNAANLLCPLGIFGTTVINSQNMVFEVPLGVGALRHGFGIEADGAAIDHVPINKRITLGIILGDHHVGARHEKRDISARANGHPFRTQDLCRVRMHGVDAVKLAYGVSHGHEIRPQGCAVRAPSRVHANHDRVFAVACVKSIIKHVDAATSISCSKTHQFGNVLERARRARAVMGHLTAVKIQHIEEFQPLDEEVRKIDVHFIINISTVRGLLTTSENGTVSIGFLDARYFVCHHIESFVPRDALPLVNAT